VGAAPDHADPDELATLAEHWDGTSLTAVLAPSLGEEDNVLEAVAGVASDDVWAVGHEPPVVQGPPGPDRALGWDVVAASTR